MRDREPLAPELREVGLVALQASVLARRIFDTRGRRRDALDPARTEIVMRAGRFLPGRPPAAPQR